MGTDNFNNFEIFDEELAMNFHVDLYEMSHSGMILFINLFKKDELYIFLLYFDI